MNKNSNDVFESAKRMRARKCQDPSVYSISKSLYCKLFVECTQYSLRQEYTEIRNSKVCFSETAARMQSRNCRAVVENVFRDHIQKVNIFKSKRYKPRCFFIKKRDLISQYQIARQELSPCTTNS